MTVSKRAFERSRYETPIEIRESVNGNTQGGRLQNTGEGGLYFETDAYVAPGTDLLITEKSKTGAVLNNGAKGYRAEVVWCEKKRSGASDTYGVGARFMVDHCSQCGCKIPPHQIRKTRSLNYLCPHCAEHRDTLREGSLFERLESFLHGNVV